MTDTTDSAIFKLGMDASQYKREAAEVVRAGEAVADAQAKITVSEERLDRATRTTADGFAKLEARYDPLIRLEQQRERALAQAKRYLDEGSISNTRYGEQVARVNTYIDNQIAALNKQAPAFDSVGAALGKVNTLLGLFGASLSIAAIIGFTRQVANSVGGLADQAEQLGVNVELLQSLRFSAVQAGVSQEQMDSATMKFVRSIGEAARGNGQAVRTFDQLGVGILDLNGKLRKNEEILADVARAITGMDEPTQKALLSTELFGKAGQRFQTVLSDLGQRGLPGFLRAAREAGAVADKELINKFKEASDAAARFGMQLTVGMAGAIERIGRGIDEVILSPLRSAWDLYSRFVGKPFEDLVNRAGFDTRTRNRDLEATRGFAYQAMNVGTTAPVSQEMAKTFGDLAEEKQRLQDLIAATSQGDAAIQKITDHYAALNAVRKLGLDASDAERAAVYNQTRDNLELARSLDVVTRARKAELEVANKRVDAFDKQEEADRKRTEQFMRDRDAFKQAMDDQIKDNEQLADAAAKTTVVYNALTGAYEVNTRALDRQRMIIEAVKKGLSPAEAQQQVDALLDQADAMKKINDAQRAAVDIANNAQAETVRIWTRAAENIQDALTGAFRSAFDRGGSFGKRFFDSLKNAALDAASQIVTAFAFKPVIGGLFQAVGAPDAVLRNMGIPAGLPGATSATGGGNSFFNIGRFFGFGGSSGGASPLSADGGFDAMGTLSNLSTLYSVGSSIGGFLGGPAYGGVSLAGGLSSTFGLGAGGAAAASQLGALGATGSAGSIASLGVTSGAASGGIGGLGAAGSAGIFAALIVLGRMIQDSNKDNFIGKGLLGLMGPGIDQAIANPNLLIATAIGLPFLNAFGVFGGEDKQFPFAKSRATTTDRYGGVTPYSVESLDGGDTTAMNNIVKAVGDLLKGVRGITGATFNNNEKFDVVTGRWAGDFSIFNAGQQFSGGPEQATLALLRFWARGDINAVQGLRPASKQVLQRATSFDDLTEGLSFAEQFQDWAESATDYDKSLRALNRTMDEAIRLAEKYGLDVAVIEKERQKQIEALNAQKNASAQASAFGAITNLRAFVRGAAYGDLTALTPEQQIAMAQNEFNAVSGAALAGDFNSISALPTYAETYLRAERARSGSGIGYVEAFNRVLDVVNQIAQTDPGTLTERAFIAETRTQTEVLKTTVDTLRQEVVNLRNDITQALNRPARAA